APFLAVLAVLVEWRLSWCRMNRLAWAFGLALLALAGTHYLTAWAFATQCGQSAGRSDVAHLLVHVLRVQFGAVTQMLPRQLWIPLLGMGVGAAVVSCLIAFRALDNRRTWSLLFLGVLLTVSALLLLVNVPFSPWSMQAARGVLPVATYVLAGIGIALLTASWRALAVLANPVDTRREDPDEVVKQPAVYAATRMAGILIAPLLLAVIVICGVVNGFRHATDDGSFADRAADVVLDGLHGRSWVVGNGMLDANLMIRAYERGIPMHLLSPQRASQQKYTASVLQLLAKDAHFGGNTRLRAESLISYNFLVFIEDLFATDPKIGDKAVSMGLPDIWYGSGWVPVPEVLFYGGVRDLAALKNRDLAAGHEAFWKQWAPFLKAGPGSPSQISYRPRLMLSRHLAFVANNLGVSLDDLGRAEDAFHAYQRAHTLDPENISALLNLYEMVSRGLHPELKNEISSELRRKVERPSQRYSLWALSRYYGYVRNSDAFVQMGWTWALSSNPGSVLAGLRSAQSLQAYEGKRLGMAAMMAALHEMRGDLAQGTAGYRKILADDPRNTAAISGLVRLSLRQNVLDEARKVLEDGERAGASKRLLRQNWAALHLVSGDLPRARIILQELADEPDAPPMTLAMLAMVMIEQNEAKAVETAILPKLAKAVGSGHDLYFSLVVQGRIWQSKGKPGYKNAQLCFQRAAAIRPDVPALREVILMLDAAMENQAAAEAHALVLLRQTPDHPFANFIIGSIRLEQGQYADAELYLRRSAAAPKPTHATLNNLAQTLCRSRKLEEAERIARLATANEPERYEGWSTLAYVLATAGKLGEATVSLTKAHLLGRDDARIYLVDALLAVKCSDPAAAAKALASAGPESTLGLSERRDLAYLKAEIARLPPRK
ncbi:MAG: tetratricopeptide repeat protein, partial [bacterium]